MQALMTVRLAASSMKIECTMNRLCCWNENRNIILINSKLSTSNASMNKENINCVTQRGREQLAPAAVVRAYSTSITLNNSNQNNHANFTKTLTHTYTHIRSREWSERAHRTSSHKIYHSRSTGSEKNKNEKFRCSQFIHILLSYLQLRMSVWPYGLVNITSTQIHRIN